MSKSSTKMQTYKHLVEDARTIGILPEEVRQIQEVVKRHRFPADVRSVEVNFGRDWVGAPAAWILFSIQDDLNPSKEKISGLNRFADSVRDDLLKTNPSYWPYIDFRATS